MRLASRHGGRDGRLVVVGAIDQEVVRYAGAS
jgi:hypothetical protein